MKFVSTTPLTARQMRLLQVIEDSLTQRPTVRSRLARHHSGDVQSVLRDGGGAYFEVDLRSSQPADW